MAARKKKRKSKKKTGKKKARKKKARKARKSKGRYRDSVPLKVLEKRARAAVGYVKARGGSVAGC